MTLWIKALGAEASFASIVELLEHGIDGREFECLYPWQEAVLRRVVVPVYYSANIVPGRRGGYAYVNVQPR